MNHADPPQSSEKRHLNWRALSTRWLIVPILLIIPILYMLTLAQGLVLGDPTEYTFVANVLGIAHPPGYAFITLVGKLFQLLNPLGDVPWRTHLMSAISATAASLFIFGTIRTIGRTLNSPERHRERRQLGDRQGLTTTIAALFGALVVATATDFWQHAIHTNPHIITATFLTANIFFLTKWWARERSVGEKVGAVEGYRIEQKKEESIPGDEQWNQALPEEGRKSLRSRIQYPNLFLFAFCFTAGLGVTHHPLTVFSFPAYALFVLWVRPRIWRDWRTLIRMVILAVLGLGVWLYYPIRSPMGPLFGPDNMNTLNGFLDHVLARGLTESLPFYGLVDQFDRALVFWSLLRLQYSLPTIILAFVGVLSICGMRIRGESSLRIGNTSLTSSSRSLAPLFLLALLGNYTFVISLRQQDIMAYLLGVFTLVGMLAGVGLLSLLSLIQRRIRLESWRMGLLVGTIFCLGPVLQVVRNLPHISLREYSEGDDYLTAVSETFEGKGMGAVLLNDWEHMTPLWYDSFVDKRQLDPTDVTARLVSTDRPWVQSVFDFLPGGPVFLSGYRPDIVRAGFRLRPFGAFYQVVEPGDQQLPSELTAIHGTAIAEIEVLAYQLPRSSVPAGEYVPFTLAMRMPQSTEIYYTPVLNVGDMVYEFTTDSHLITPLWQAEEVIVERFDFALPHDLGSGDYPLSLGIRDLSNNRDTALSVDLGYLSVTTHDNPPAADTLLAQFRQRVGLASAKARVGFSQQRSAPWDDPIQVTPGDTIHLTLEWESLAPAEESYTIFVHLIDLANRPLVTLDYTPLGGSTPTHLWIPKWLPGQQMLDPYRLTLPNDLSPGTYLIEVGLYEMTGGRRLHISDEQGNLRGDRYILGSIIVP